MKKFVIFVFTLLIICFPVSNLCFAESAPIPSNDPAFLKNIIARLMISDIKKAVDDYYSEYLFSPPQIEVYAENSSTKIISSHYDTGNNVYEVTIEVHPYVGAHNPIGHDIITFQIDGSGKVKVLEFKHVKSFEIVPWLKDNLKKPFPLNTY